MKIDYRTLSVEQYYGDDEVTIIQWYCNIGYGQLTINTQTHEVIDSENMSDEFSKRVIRKYYKEKWNERF